MSCATLVQSVHDRYHRNALRYAIAALKRHRMAARLADAEDIVQDAFLQFIEQDQHIRQPEAWLIRCITNTVLKLARKKQPLDLQGDARTLSDRNTQNRWNKRQDEEAQKRDARLCQVEEAVRHLSPRQRQVISGLYHDGHKFKEVAKELGISPRTVRHFRDRILKLLRREVTIEG